jgi:hypothetical protein
LKDAIQGTFFFALMAVWLAPVVFGVLDAACWFAIAQQCTSIQWLAHDGLRIFVAFLWTIGAPLLLLMVCS